MPNFSGIWTVTQQMQAKGASTWPAVPGAPTIGTATAGGSNCASVTFTAPACTGYPATITSYRVISTPGCITQTGASSPLVVSGLTTGTSYTFKAQATNATGDSALSAASNSITAAFITCASYTSAGTYSFVVPAGVTSVASVVVGGGSSGAGTGGGGGGALSYVNGISVTPLETLTVLVGVGGASVYGPSYGKYGGASRLSRGGTALVSTVQWTGCCGGANLCYKKGQTVGVGTGGAGGLGRDSAGGAGGYSGAGGAGQCYNSCGAGNSGSGGAGGGGKGGGYWSTGCCTYTTGGGGGGGVGIFGQGSNGAGGTSPAPQNNPSYYAGGGGGGSGGNAGAGTGLSLAGIRSGGSGGAYGGGGGATANSSGGVGAVRIVWAGGARGTPSFPSTCVGA